MEWFAIPFSGALPDPGIEPRSPALQLSSKESDCNAIAAEDPGLGRSPAGGQETHSSILVWKIPWTKGPGRLQSIGSQRVGHN